jgi:hypothetical protein
MGLLLFSTAALLALSLVTVAELTRRLVARLLQLRVRRLGLVYVRLAGGRRRDQLAVLAVGPIVVYLGAAALAFGLFTCTGVPVPAGVVRVGEVQPNSAAAGVLVPGDTIFAVDGEPVYAGSGPGVAALVQRQGGNLVELAIDHGGELRAVTIQPRRDNRGLWRLGIVLDSSGARDYSIGATLPPALAFPPRYIAGYFHAVVAILSAEERADPGGPTALRREYSGASAVYFGSSLLDVAAMLASILAFVVLLIDVIRAIGVLRQPRRDPLAT